VLCHRLQHGCAFDKGHRVKRFAAALNRIATGGRHVQPFAGHAPQRFATDGVMNSAFAAPPDCQVPDKKLANCCIAYLQMLRDLPLIV
jgi:hypothetical protein